MLRSALILAVVLISGSAVAQQAGGTTVDLSPLLANVVYPILSALVLALGGWAVQKFAAMVGLKNTQALQSTVESALQNALAYGQSKVADVPLTIDVKNQIVANAANYATAHVPDALSKLGITKDQLVQKLQARLALNTIPPEQSVAVPTPPAA